LKLKNRDLQIELNELKSNNSKDLKSDDYNNSNKSKIESNDIKIKYEKLKLKNQVMQNEIDEQNENTLNLMKDNQ